MNHFPKSYNKGLPATDGRGKETEKRKKQTGRRGNNVRAAKDTDANTPSTSTKPTPRTSNASRKYETGTVHRILNTSFKAAHVGVSQDLIDKRKQIPACTRCGRKFYSWNKCRDTDPVTVGAAKAKKRKAEDQGEKAEKKPRVALQVAAAKVPK